MPLPEGRGGIDYPDFGLSASPHGNPTEITRAENAARLGSPAIFEQSGNILAYDLFEYGLGPWRVAGDADADKPTLSAAYWRLRPYAVRMHSLGADIPYSSITRQFPFPYPTTVGVEWSFLAQATFHELWLYLFYGTADTLYQGGICIDDLATIISYYNSGGGTTPLGDYDCRIGTGDGWHIAKVVLDLVNQEYLRFLIDGQDISMPDIPMQTGGGGTNERLILQFKLVPTFGNSEELWIDNVIVTINEPS